MSDPMAARERRVIQPSAVRIPRAVPALSRCETSLVRAKAQKAGDQPLYDFGPKVCELHKFENQTIALPPPEPPQQSVTQQPAPAPTPAAAAPSPPAPPSVASPQVPPEPQVSNQSSASPSATIAAPQAVPVASQPSSAPANPSPPIDSPTARRLRELNQLLKDGLVTDSEYQEKRKAILSTM